MQNVEVIRPAKDVAVIALRGDHDAVTKDQLAGLLASEVARNDLVIVDLTGTEFIDSSVLHNLIEADRLARVRGGRLVVQLGAARTVRGMFEINHGLRTLHRVETRGEALFRSPPGDPVGPGIKIGAAA